jgi:hypothetical protein
MLKQQLNESRTFIGRLYSGLNAYTYGEDKATLGLDDFTKSYLVNRKTIVLLALIVRIFDLVIGIAAFSFTIEEVIQLSTSNSAKFIIMVILVESLLLLYNVVILILNCKIYRTWSQFKISLYYSRKLAWIVMIAPIVIATIPIYREIKNHHDAGVADDKEDYVFDVAIIQIIASIVPVITNAQNFMTSSNVLINELKNTYELLFVRSVCVIIYVPIYLTAIIILFNLTLNYLILVAGVVYTVYILLPITRVTNQSNQVIRIIGWILAVILIALVVIIAVHLIGDEISAFIVLSIISAIIGSYINYLLMSVIMIDLICSFTIKYREETSDKTDMFTVLIGACTEETDDGYKKITNKQRVTQGSQ